MLKFGDPNKGPWRLFPGDKQDPGEALRIELDRLVSLLHPADAITEGPARARAEPLRRFHRSISEFVARSPATTISTAFRRLRRRRESWRVVWTTCHCKVACWQCRNPFCGGA